MGESPIKSHVKESKHIANISNEGKGAIPSLPAKVGILIWNEPTPRIVNFALFYTKLERN